MDGHGLTGPIPVELGNLTNLRSLYLQYNDLSGPIPVELGNLTSLIELQLGRNELSGPLPVELANLTNSNGFRFATMHCLDRSRRNWAVSAACGFWI